jgi:hypothetical protein
VDVPSLLIVLVREMNLILLAAVLVVCAVIFSLALTKKEPHNQKAAHS